MRFFTLLLISACLLPLLPARAQFFTDVTPADPGCNTINECAFNQLFEGYPDGNFKPNSPLGRREMIMLAARLLNIAFKGFMTLPNNAQPAHWQDITESHWCYQAATFLADNGVTAFKGSRAHLERPATRGEFTSVIEALMEPETRDACRENGVFPAEWAKNSQKTVTRLEAARVAEFALRMMTHNAVTEGIVKDFIAGEQGLRWVSLDTPLGECRLVMPENGVLINGGAAADVKTGRRIRLISDAVLGVNGDRYFRVREATLLKDVAQILRNMLP